MCASAGPIGTRWVVKGGVNLRLEHTHITRKAPFRLLASRMSISSSSSSFVV